MDSDRDVLLSIAEIAAAFAGFAALAGVIGRRSAESEERDFERLRSVVLASLVVVVALLVPIVLLRFGLSGFVAWRLASGLALALNILGMVQVFRGGTYTPTGYTLEAIMDVALMANLLALFPENMAALYLAFLVLLLCQAVVAFLGLLASLFGPKRGE
jgi:hypothetical protein